MIYIVFEYEYTGDEGRFREVGKAVKGVYWLEEDAQKRLKDAPTRKHEKYLENGEYDFDWGIEEYEIGDVK